MCVHCPPKILVPVCHALVISVLAALHTIHYTKNIAHITSLFKSLPTPLELHGLYGLGFSSWLIRALQPSPSPHSKLYMTTHTSTSNCQLNLVSTNCGMWHAKHRESFHWRAKMLGPDNKPACPTTQNVYIAHQKCFRHTHLFPFSQEQIWCSSHTQCFNSVGDSCGKPFPH